MPGFWNSHKKNKGTMDGLEDWGGQDEDLNDVGNIDRQLGYYQPQYLSHHPVHNTDIDEDLSTDDYPPDYAAQPHLRIDDMELEEENRETRTYGQPYNEDRMSVTNVRRGGRKWKPDSLIKPSKIKKGIKPRPETKPVPCPDKCGACVSFRDCAQCQKYQVWDEKDGDLKRCYQEYKDLESRGHYDGTWDDHPENFAPETFERIQEEKRLNEKINSEMELEREEFDKRAEELEKNGQSVHEYYKNKYAGDNEGYEEEEENEDDEKDYEEDYERKIF